MARPITAPPLVSIQTLGCAKNEADSRDMADRLRAAGIRLTDDASACDVIIVNTCSFIQAATEESIEAVLDALDVPGDEGRNRCVIVSGCMPARYGADLEASIPEADVFLPCSEEVNIVEAVCSLTGFQATSAPVEAAPELPFAHVKISDGCDRWCSFCTIPKIRGPYRSFSFEDILAEVRALRARGMREAVLIGQDTGIWGSDLGPEDDLPSLLHRLAQEVPDMRFRVMYTEPEGVTDELLDVMVAHPNVCPYLDIPLQHVSPRILRRMRRSGSALGFQALVERIREKLPHITLRTTLMCGFPGETDEEFEELVSFVRQGLFDYVGVFAFSQEEGTKAASMEDQVPEEVKELRARELRDEADSVSAAMVADRVGSMVEVLVEGIEEDGQAYGRAACQAPEVDGVTYVDAGEPGDMVRVRIEDALLYDMEGAVL